MTTLIVALGAVTGGFVQGFSGFAFGLVAIAFWAWLLEPRLVGPLIVVGSLTGHVMSIGAVRRGMDIRRILPLLVGGAIGIPIGVALFHLVNPIGFKIGVGALLLIWCPAMLFAPRVPKIGRVGWPGDALVGAVGGVMCGLGGLGGPAPTLWCTLRGWNRDAQRATFQSFNFALQIATFVAYAATGVITVELTGYFLLVAVCVIVPALAGAEVYKRFGEHAFRHAVLVLLTVSGFVLLASVAPHFLRHTT